MNKSKQPPKSTEVSLVHSSAVEYLTFGAATGGGSAIVEVRYEDENFWLTQWTPSKLERVFDGYTTGARQ